MKVSAINNNVYVKKNNFYSSNKKVDNSQQNLTTFTEGNKKKSPWAIVLAILALIGSTSLQLIAAKNNETAILKISKKKF